MTGGMIVALLALLALAYVIAPLRVRGPRSEVSSTRPELEEKKRAALTAILDLESERDVGKLSEQDLAELRGRYEAEALEAMAAMDVARVGEDADALEREIARVRSHLEGTDEE